MSDLNNMDYQPESDNPLGDIDPMAWLESLAARQGATEGFTTDYSSVHVPEIDPNSVVLDEPGYTPYESFGQDTSKVQAAPETPSAPVSPEPVQTFGQPEEQLMWAGFGQAAEPVQEEPSIWSSLEQQAPAQPEPSAAEVGYGIPEGVDPLAWLESLAARQGATEGFTRDYTGIEVPEIDPNSVVLDEPGYTPSETFQRQTAPEEAPPAPMEAFGFQEFAEPQAAESVQEEPSIWSSLEQQTPAQFEAAPVPAEQPWGDFGAGTLGETEDFLSALSEDASLIPNMEEVAFGEPPSSVAPAEAGADLSWLSELSGGTEASGLEFLEQIAEPIEPPAQPTPAEEAIPATHTPEQIIASIDGMSDEELAQAQANRTLTPEQELAWLQRQAMSLFQARQQAEAEEISFEDLPPAEASEIPEWLRQSAVVTDEPEDSSIFVEQLAIPSEPEDMPDWLRSDVPARTATSEMELPDFTLEEASGTPEPVSELPAAVEAGFESVLKLDQYDPSKDEWAEALDEEHERITAGIIEDPTWFRTAKERVQLEETAPPAEAQPPSVEPTWLGQVTEEAPQAAAIPDDLPDWLRPVATAAAAAGETDDIDIETWLRTEETAATAEEVPGIAAAPAIQTPPLPLRAEPTPRLEVPPADSEKLAAASAGPLPAWARSAPPSPTPVQPSQRAAAVMPPPPAPRAEPAPRPMAPPPPPPRPAAPRVAVATKEPVPPAGAPAAVPETFGHFKAKLEQNPNDHATRLALAREIAKTGDVDASVQQYQTLVEQMGELDAVSEDLRSLITTAPSYPALRRLLGDVYMRQGYLQEALDAYRGALDNL